VRSGLNNYEQLKRVALSFVPSEHDARPSVCLSVCLSVGMSACTPPRTRFLQLYGVTPAQLWRPSHVDMFLLKGAGSNVTHFQNENKGTKKKSTNRSALVLSSEATTGRVT